MSKWDNVGLKRELRIRISPSGQISTFVVGQTQPVDMTLDELVFLSRLAAGSSIDEALVDSGGAVEGAAVERLIGAGVLEDSSAGQRAEVADLDRPIFLFGAPASGTSLVARFLGKNSRIMVQREWALPLSLREFFRSDHGGMTASALGLRRNDVLPQLRALLSEYQRPTLEEQGAARWLDAATSTVRVVDFLHRLYEGHARFILGMRHPLSSAVAIVAAHERPGAADRLALLPQWLDTSDSDEQRAIRWWCLRSDLMRRFRTRHPEACFTYRYEDLVADPPSVLEPLCEFLGEDYDAGHLTALAEEGVPRAGIDADSVDRRGEWSAPVVDSVRDIFEPELAHWGYDE